jgi:hypothetical protein
MFDKNQIINDFAKKWNNKLKPFWADDGNEFGAIRGRWYNGDYAGALDPFAQEIINLQALVAEKDKLLLEAPEAGVVESLQAKEDEITKLKAKITELEARPQTNAISLDEIKDLINKPNLEMFDFDKFKVGLSKYAWLQSIIGVAITAVVAWVVSYVPELEPYKAEIITGMFALIGVSAVGQNGAQIAKNI